jgi:hypothetical protein
MLLHWINHVLKSTTFYDIMLCSKLKVSRCFRGTFRLYLQGRISRAWYQCESRWEAGIVLFLTTLWEHQILQTITLYSLKSVFQRKYYIMISINFNVNTSFRILIVYICKIKQNYWNDLQFVPPINPIRPSRSIVRFMCNNLCMRKFPAFPACCAKIVIYALQTSID